MLTEFDAPIEMRSIDRQTNRNNEFKIQQNADRCDDDEAQYCEMKKKSWSCVTKWRVIAIISDNYWTVATHSHNIWFTIWVCCGNHCGNLCKVRSGSTYLLVVRLCASDSSIFFCFVCRDWWFGYFLIDPVQWRRIEHSIALKWTDGNTCLWRIHRHQLR